MTASRVMSYGSQGQSNDSSSRFSNLLVSSRPTRTAQVFIDTGVFMGVTVAVKHFDITTEVMLTRQDLLELKMVSYQLSIKMQKAKHLNSQIVFVNGRVCFKIYMFVDGHSFEFK